MAVQVVVNLVQDAADVLTIYGAGAKVYLYSAATEAGTYNAVTSTTVVSGTEQYEIVDANGSSSTWYKTRIGNSGGSAFDEYSDAFRATSIQAYATVDDLTESMNLPNGDRYNYLADLLVRASSYLDMACRRDFYRHPQVSGTETRIYNVLNSGQSVLSHAVGSALDIVSISLLEATDSSGGTYTTIASGSSGYYLSPRNPDAGWPYGDVNLSDGASTFRYFPSAYGAIQITGVFGWASVPPLIQQATIDLAREWYRQGPGGGGPIGISALGQPQYQQGNPPSVRQAVELYRRWSLVVV